MYEVGADSVMIGEALYFVPLVIGYFVVDRLFSRYYTGSWWKQPEDLERDKR